MKLGNLYLSAITSNNHGVDLMEQRNYEQAAKAFSYALASLKSSVEQQQHDYLPPAGPYLPVGRVKDFNDHSNSYKGLSQSLAFIQIQLEEQRKKESREQSLSYSPLKAKFVTDPSVKEPQKEQKESPLLLPIRIDPNDKIDEGCDDVLKLDVETVIVLLNISCNYMSRVKEGFKRHDCFQKTALKILYLAYDLIDETLKSLPSDLTMNILFGIHQVENIVLDAVVAVSKTMAVDKKNHNGKLIQIKERQKALQHFFLQYKAICSKECSPSAANAA